MQLIITRRQALATLFTLLKHVIAVRSPIAPTMSGPFAICAHATEILVLIVCLKPLTTPYSCSYKEFIVLMPLLWGHVGLQQQLCDGLAGDVLFHRFRAIFRCNYLAASRC